MVLRFAQRMFLVVLGLSQILWSCGKSEPSTTSLEPISPESFTGIAQTELKNNLSVDSLNTLAIDLYMRGDYQRALDYISVAYKKSNYGKDKAKLAKILNTLGLVHWRLGNNKDAMQCYLQAGAIAKSENEERLLGLTYTNRSLILKEEGSYEEALVVNDGAIKIFQKNNLLRDLAIALNNQGQIYKKKDELQVAKSYYNRALKNYEKVDFKDGIAATYHNLSQIAMWQGDKVESLSNGQKSLALGLNIDSKVRVSEAYRRIAETYEHFKEHDSALKYYKSHYEVQQEILKNNQSENLARFQAQMGAEVKNLRIDNLEKEKKIAQNRFWLMLVLGFTLLLIAGFVISRYVTQMRFRRKKLERELDNYNHLLEVKEQELKSYILDLSNKTNLIATLQDKLSQSMVLQDKDEAVVQLLETKILTEEDWETFKTKFRSIHPGFFNRMNEAQHHLTEAEIRYMLLLRLKLNSKEMAGILGISPQSVRVCKMRLKKKLNNEGIESVEAFLKKLIY